MKNTLCKRILCAMLTSVMVASMTACGGETAENKTDMDTKTTESVPATESETVYLDTLPVTNMEGYLYRMMASHSDDRPNFGASDELTGEVQNDAIYNRKMATMDRLNIQIEDIIGGDRGATAEAVTKTVQAGEDAYDVVINALTQGIDTLVTSRYLADLTTIPYLTLESERWNESLAKNVRINGKQFFTAGVTSVCYLYTPQVVLFNQDIAEDNSLPDLYELVLEGKWTVDMMNTCMQNVAVDLNGDGVMKPEDDRYAFTVEGTFGNALYMAAGFTPAAPDAAGNWSLHVMDAASVDYITKAVSIFANQDYIHLDFNDGEEPSRASIFQEGRSLFMSYTVLGATRFREMEADWGILPNPVLMEGDPYYTSCNCYLPSGICVPITNPNLERTGLIMETMAAYSYDYIMPAVIEKVLGKVTRDSESYQIMKSIYDTTAFDLNAIMNFGGSSVLLREVMLGAKENFASSFQSIQKSSEAALADYIAAATEEN